MNFQDPKKVLILSLLLINLNQVSAQKVCIDSILIDGFITKIMKHKDFINAGIKIDSVTSAKPMDSYDPDSMIYVGSSLFWYDSRRGTCDAKSIQFDKIETIKLGRFLITKLTTLDDLQKIFPTDCANIRPVKIYKQDGYFDMFGVPVCNIKGELWDMRIVFYLKNNIIYKIAFWEPM